MIYDIYNYLIKCKTSVNILCEVLESEIVLEHNS